MTTMLQLYICNAIASIVMFGILFLLAVYPDPKGKQQK